MTVVPFNAKCLTDADVQAVRPRILRMIQSGVADRWNLDMSYDGYTAITVLGRRDDVLFSITKDRGAYRVADPVDRQIVQTRRLENVLASLP